MSDIRHVRILASAGSGKTFQLTNRCLHLLLAGAPPSSILASTFTRLAAGEIRDRILGRLADAASDDATCAELGDAIGMPGLDRTRVRQCLVEVARNLHLLQVRTLDSLFASLVTCFSLEIGLPLGTELADEDEELLLRSIALRRTLERQRGDELIELLRMLSEGAERYVRFTLDDVIDKLYNAYRDSTDDAWTWIKPRPGRLDEAALHDAIDRLASIFVTSKALSGGRGDDVDQARAGDWEGFIRSGLAAKVALGQNSYKRAEITPELLDAYTPLVAHAGSIIVDRERKHLAGTKRLLDAFDEEFEALKRERGILTFNDLAYVLGRAHLAGDLDAVRYRLDASLHHMLLDEFQDTSVAQWRVLEAFAHDIVSHLPPERSLLCVGDVKQSIYGWRDAVPEILGDLGDHLHAGEALAEETLAESWRSSQVVIDSVNEVFGNLGSNEALDDDERARDEWAGMFAEHTTARDLEGRVELHVTDYEYKTDVGRIRAAAELIRDLHEANPGISIGVLTRSNRTVAQMLFELGPTRLDVAASGRGGGALTDAAAIGVLLDALRLADHPDDSAAAFNVATSPLGAHLGFDAYGDRKTRRTFSTTVRSTILERGVGPVVAEWIHAIAGSCDERERGRVLQLADLAEAFDARGGAARIAEFISFVETSPVADDGVACVEVMTIHQSKGLQFDAVVLPELDFDLSGKGEVLLARDGPLGPVSRVARMMNESRRVFIDGAEAVAEEGAFLRAREGLCLLYVAMTRAVHGLYMFVSERSKSSKRKRYSGTAAGVVHAALAHDVTEPGIAYEHGDPSWISRVSRERVLVSASETPPPVEFATAAPAPARRALRSSAPSSHRSRGSEVARRLREDDEGRDRGTVLHAALETIEWLDDDPGDAAIRRACRGAAPHRSDAWIDARVADVRTLLGHDSVRAILTAPADRSSVEVRRELPFVRFEGEGSSGGIIDRLVVTRNAAGAATAAEIIDWKTDAVADEADALADQAETHRKQLEDYRDAAAELLDLGQQAISMRVVFTGPGRVVDLDPQPSGAAEPGTQGTLFE